MTWWSGPRLLVQNVIDVTALDIQSTATQAANESFDADVVFDDTPQPAPGPGILEIDLTSEADLDDTQVRPVLLRAR